MIEHFFTCPNCMTRVSSTVDPDQRKQNFTEDCEYCNHPVSIRLEIEGVDILWFDAICCEEEV
ncbi:CPXCG motif-containing cysteine-rich protein [Roseivirga sp. BDSF3-8]|uniref:CPXCG motif-containing cysteine-rich protein n=1 Tax=Roseivirga sp. BDSF3-8 TaxID=3241598 RepID=UPI003532157C